MNVSSAGVCVCGHERKGHSNHPFSFCVACECIGFTPATSNELRFPEEHAESFEDPYERLWILLGDAGYGEYVGMTPHELAHAIIAMRDELETVSDWTLNCPKCNHLFNGPWPLRKVEP